MQKKLQEEEARIKKMEEEMDKKAIMLDKKLKEK
jgi:hypothetical protein